VKKIEAVIKPFRLEAVTDEFAKTTRFTVTEVSVSVPSPTSSAIDQQMHVPLRQLQITMLCEDVELPDFIARLRRAAYTGRIYDGVITVTDAIFHYINEAEDRR